MSASSSSRARFAVVVRRLRDAGCVFAEEEAGVLVAEARTAAELDAMVERRTAGEPLEHVVGWADFCGLRIGVDPGVFVPRRRSEHLVHQAVGLAAPRSATGRPVVVVDLCCGSGAVSLAIATRLAEAGAADRAERPNRAEQVDRVDRVSRVEIDQVEQVDRISRVELHAVDVDPAAVACARRNLAPVGGRVHHGDLDGPLPASLQGRVDVLVANAPYVPTGDVALLPPEARDHEPRSALDGGPDGLAVVRRVIAAAPRWLASDGHLLVETSKHQAPEAADAATRAGLVPRVVTSDDLAATTLIATRPTAT